MSKKLLLVLITFELITDDNDKKNVFNKIFYIYFSV